MDFTAKILLFVFDVIVPLIVGFFLRRAELSYRWMDWMMAFAIIVIEPVLGCLSFWDIHLSANLFALPLAGMLMMLVPGVIGYLRSGSKFSGDPLKKGSYVLAAMLSNRGVVGMLTVFAIYGEKGYALVQLATLLGTPFFYFFCFPLAEHYHQQDSGAAPKRGPLLARLFNWKQLPLLGMAAGVLVNVGNVTRPAATADIFPWLVHLDAWLFVIPVGYELVFDRMRSSWKGTTDLVWTKFLLTPLCMLLVARLLGLDAMSTNVLVILGFAPTAINAVVTARLFRLDINVSMAAFMLTTVVYLVVVLPGLFLTYSRLAFIP